LGQVAVYCRVSTDDQCCERQERDLKAFARRSGHKIVAVFKETASGADDDRPERKKVMALARAREIEAILVTSECRAVQEYSDGNRTTYRVKPTH
jgi:putative DNA-invertase from lambdoid prophage Rac